MGPVIMIGGALAKTRDAGKLSETAPIRRLLLKHPREAWRDQARVREEWRALNYPEEPDFTRACEEYDVLAGILRRSAGEVSFLPADSGTGLDSIYVRDAAVEAPHGLVIGRMGKELRRGEPGAVRAFCARAGWPVAGEVLAPGTLEGGDVVWLDTKTVAVGLGYRTNAEGLRQLAGIVGPDGVETVGVPLPHWDGPGDVLHLMSLLSPVDERKLLVHSRLLVVPFRRRLLEMGFELIEVPDEEYATMGTNVLALGGGRCLALAGNPRTASRLEKAGLEVLTYRGREISVKGAGGPTCLTRPVRRSGT
jgi:N-dimethylarginine dimethylaminohydrolase